MKTFSSVWEKTRFFVSRLRQIQYMPTKINIYHKSKVQTLAEQARIETWSIDLFEFSEKAQSIKNLSDCQSLKKSDKAP